MVKITDEYMKQLLSTSKNYTIVILRKTEKINEPGTDKIKYEHGKRNFKLRKEGIMPIVCRIDDNSDISGIAIFNRNSKEVKQIMDKDPGVIAGIFTYEVHICSSFPNDKLPE